MIKAKVNKIIPFSSVDGPGCRVAIFFQECNINCKYCHNPETINKCASCGDCVKTCPTGALEKIEGKVKWNRDKCVGCETCVKTCDRNSSPITTEYTPSELFLEIEKYFPFSEGVTVSGGECSLQYKFLIEFFALVRPTGKTIFVDSNGIIDYKTLDGFVESFDYLMLDIKSTEENEHRELVGESCENVLKNAKYLADIGKLFEIRTVVVPELLDNARNVYDASKLISEYENIRYKIIKFRNHGVRKELLSVSSPTDEYMEKLKEIAQENGVKDIVII